MSNKEQREPTVSVSMSRKINLGNYESAECFVSVSNVHEGMTADQIDTLLETGKLTWERVRLALIDQIRDAKNGGI